ncbi:MAG: hypothetical protein GY711_30525 [bacterium]|nr:hypothetical protein [bacterium]
MEARAEDNLRALAKSLANDLDTKVAFICEVCDDRRERARTVALYVDHAYLDNIEYDLAGTPCAGVYDEGVLIHTADTSKIYPSDHILQEWSIESYMGVPFYDDDGKLIGHVGVMDDTRRKSIGDSRPTLEKAAAHVCREMLRRKQSR